MALVTNTKNPQTPPHEPGVTFVFRPLSKRELREAEDANTRKTFELLPIMRASMSDQDWDKQQEAAAQRRIEKPVTPDPADSYDQDTLLKYGLLSWSGPGYEAPCNEATKAQLDPQTYDWAVGVILDMNVRSQGEE